MSITKHSDSWNPSTPKQAQGTFSGTGLGGWELGLLWEWFSLFF